MPEGGLSGKSFGNYRIGELLGQGGMAAVYKATDIQLQREVAIKFMHPNLVREGSFQQRFLQEARAAARLDHPNIIRVLSFDNVDGQLFLVMEYILGGSLRQYFKRLKEEARFIDYPEAIEVVRQVCEGLAYAHQSGMIHRDIKPDNVLLKPDAGNRRINYRPILTDFGLARLTDADPEATDRQPIGTYPYMSPEQVEAGELDARSDIYSMGIMLYELSVGSLPYNPKNIAEALRMHTREPLTLPSALRPGFPPELEQIIVKSLAKDRESRYANGAEMAAALQAIQKPLPPPPPTLEPLKPPPQQPLVVRRPSVTPADQNFATDRATKIMPELLPDVMPAEGLPTRENNQHDRLIFASPNYPPRAFPMDRDSLVVGRDEHCSIVLEGETVSRRHIQVERKPNGRYYITDLGSSNGVWLNGEKLSASVPVVLDPGKTLRMGEYWMVLELKPAEVIPQISTKPAEGGMVVEDAEEPPLPDQSPEEEAPVTQVSGLGIGKEAPHFTSPQTHADKDRLIFFSEDQQPVIFPLAQDQNRWTVGRYQNQDVVLPSRSVSRRHARVERVSEGKYVIIDVGSSGGVFVGDRKQPTNKAVSLDPDKNIRIGDYWVRFEPKVNIAVVRDMPRALDLESQQDPNATVEMDPLPEHVRDYEAPFMSPDLRASDRFIFISADEVRPVKIERETLNVGRDADQDIILTGKRVSRRHVTILCSRDGNLYVTDNNSSNGSWIGDIRLVPGTQVLWNKDEILRIGNYWVKFEQGSRAFDPFAGVSARDDYGRIGKRIRKYRIDRFLGQNAVAAVYQAEDTTLRRGVALKILHPKVAMQQLAAQRFLQEARALARLSQSNLSHPNIVKVNDFARDPDTDTWYMEMELVSGGTLRTYLNRLKSQNRPVNLSDVLNLVTQMADGLHYAHQQGLIHRDLTPESITLRETALIGPIARYQPVLTDFEIADASQVGTVQDTSRPEENYPYMSPEQCRGDRVDIRSDIYELGIILYEMLFAQPPFKPRSIAEAVRMHTREQLRIIRDYRNDVSEDLEKVIAKALEKRADNRYQTAAEMSRALQQCAAALSLDGAFVSKISRFPDAAADVQATVVMAAPLGVEMPMATRAPGVEEETQFDRLVIYSETNPTRVVELNQNVLTIGRGDDQDVRLPSDKVSRRHARLEKGTGDIYRLTALDSRNGTWLGNYKMIPDIAEIWDKGQTVRLGDYWLRLESAKDIDAEIQRLKRKQEEPEYITDAGQPPMRPAVLEPSPEQEKIGLTIANTTIRVAPGSTATMPLEVMNRSELVDHFKVEVLGLPASWVSQPPQALYLLPLNRDTTSITFHPPLSSASAAGAHAFEVRVTARAQHEIHSAAIQGSLVVEPFRSFVADLQPERVRNRGRVEVTIQNTGNTPGIYIIQAKDREQMVNFDLDGKQYKLDPGYTEYVSIRVGAKRRPFLGAAKTYPFEVIVGPAEAEDKVAPQTERGEVVASALVSGWLIAGCLITLLLCALAGILGFLYVTQTNAAAQTATIVAWATGTSFASTATAVSDIDQDGLTLAQEAQLGTDPNLADTDEDGIDDGEEIRVWKTNPLNRDTDNDGLTDGYERDNGLDPLKLDTDGDGIPDKDDPNALYLPTATITPFPTIPGAVPGQICPGSPSPSRLAIGMAGQVTEGGVANRLRDKPSKKDGAILDYLPPGTNFVVIDGPICDPDDQIRWWKVNASGKEGWTAEGEGEEYYLAPQGQGSGSASDGESQGSIGNPPKVVAALNNSLIGLQIDWNVDSSNWNQVMSLMEPLEVGWVKLQASWRALQPEKGSLGGDFDKFKNYVQEIKSHGYRVMLSIAKAPDWARPTDRSADGPPDDPNDLADFLSLLLAQMGSNIDAIEIWNEPNLKREWTGKLEFNGNGYMDLFRPAYQSIRALSSSVVIITAGLAPAGNTDVSVNDRRFLRQMYQAGLSNFGDVAIGVHPYGWGNAPDVRCCDVIDGRGWDDQPQFFFLNTLSTYHGIMLENGQGRSKLWTTEFGWATWADFSSSPPEAWMAYNTLQDSGNYILRAFGIGQALNFMGPMFLWNFNYANATTVANGNEIAGYSLLFTDSQNHVQTRPLYTTLVKRG